MTSLTPSSYGAVDTAKCIDTTPSGSVVKVNGNYLKLKAGYLFPEIGRRVKAFSAAHPDADLIRLGIGDVTEPLPLACREAMKTAIDAMGTAEGFHGYGPEQGYAWLRDAIAKQDFQSRGCDINADEIFISDGSKCDSSNILDILGEGNKVAVTDPVYPVYVDSNVMAGRTGDAGEDGRYAGLTYLPISADNKFTAEIPSEPVDLIYLCFPNNPTGAVATRSQLKAWVDYARSHNALILFDAAYEAFIQFLKLKERGIVRLNSVHSRKMPDSPEPAVLSPLFPKA
jgi:LL-diaminopimelate aminotransferase